MRAAISEVAEEIQRQVDKRRDTHAQAPQDRDADDPAPGELDAPARRGGLSRRRPGALPRLRRAAAGVRGTDSSGAAGSAQGRG